MNRRYISQMLGIFSGFILIQTPFLAAQAEQTPEATIDQFLRSNAPLPQSDAKTQQLYVAIRTWLGSYQGIRKDGKNYVATFQNALLPVRIRLNSKGEIKSYGIGCPISESLSLSQAPSEIRQSFFQQCPNLKK